MVEKANDLIIKTGDNVSVFYTGTLEDGTIFDSNEGKEPLKFEVGSGQVISGFDEAVIGMKRRFMDWGSVNDTVINRFAGILNGQ